MATVADLLKTQPPPPALPAPPGPSVASTENPFDQFDGQNAFDQFKPAPVRTTADFLTNLVAPAKGAIEALKADASRFAGAVRAGPQGPQDLIPGVSQQDRSLGSMAGDLFNLVASPVTGALNAAVVQPGANLMDKLPAPLDPKTGKPMTPEQQHAANEGIISTALMAVGPKGFKSGTVAEGMAAKYAGKVATIVTKTPLEVALDKSGALTEEGRELAAKHGVHPEDLQTAYKAVAEAPPSAEPPPAPEAPAEPPPDAAQPVEAVDAIWRNADEDHPVEIIGEPQAGPNGRSYTKIRSKAHGGEGFVPTDEIVRSVHPTGPVETPPSAAPEVPVEAPIDQTATDRLTQAQSEGVDLTKGQATQDFGTQEKEQTLLGQPSAEGNAARQFFANQQTQIATAVERFKSAFGDAAATAADRGALVKDAISSLRDSGKAGVTALYENARQLAEGLGHNAENLIHLDAAPLLAKLRELFIDESVPEQVRNALKQQAAKYGLIGESPKTVEGQTTVTLRDSTGEPSGKVTFTGPPQRLTILNAEDLRQKINTLYEADTSKQTQALKPVIDDAVQAAVERAAAEGTGDVGKAFQDARAAHAAQQQTFKAKDIVQKLIDWKKGTNTPVVLPEHAIRTIFAGGKEAVTNLKRVKVLLLSSPTEKSKAAWQAIQAHAIGQVFEDAFVLNANHGGGSLGAISGAELNSSVTRFGVDKLKVLLSESDFNQLMKLRRIIGDATIPIQRTVNHSNSAQKVIQFLAKQGMRLASVARFVPGVGPIADTARGLYAVGKEAGEAKKTLAGVRDFTPEAAAKSDAPSAEPADYARRFIKVASSDDILAPLVASAANEQSR